MGAVRVRLESILLNRDEAKRHLLFRCVLLLSPLKISSSDVVDKVRIQPFKTAEILRYEGLLGLLTDETLNLASSSAVVNRYESNDRYASSHIVLHLRTETITSATHLRTY